MTDDTRPGDYPLGNLATDDLKRGGRAPRLIAKLAGIRFRAMSSQSKPSVTVPEGNPPADLVVDDLVVGDGDAATAGQRVNVHYVGVAWSDGQQFDASWDRNEPFSFRLGAGEVISGWDRGVAGMKVGGRRQLTIPPELGYGSRGAGGVIKGGETLIFVVDLLGVR